MVKIIYRSGYKDEVTERLIEPIGLCYWGGYWHLISYCTLRNDYRDFRVDRIQEIFPTGMVFNASRHASLRDLLLKMNTLQELKPAIVRFGATTAELIKGQKYYYGLVEETTEGDVVEMTFMTPSYTNFSRWLITFLDQVEVVSPLPLINQMKRSVEKLFHQHCSDKIG